MSAAQLFGKGWQGNDDELVRHHEEEQKGFGEKRELFVCFSLACLGCVCVCHLTLTRAFSFSPVSLKLSMKPRPS